MMPGSARAVDARLVAWLKREEGFRGQPYRDTEGVWTIGYGRNLEANPLTPAEGEVLLASGLLAAVEVVTSLGPWTAALDEVRWAVLVAMAYQMGYRLKMFRHTLAEVKAGRYAAAADRMLESQWAQQTPARAQRTAEAMRSGQWPEGL